MARLGDLFVSILFVASSSVFNSTSWLGKTYIFSRVPIFYDAELVSILGFSILGSFYVGTDFRYENWVSFLLSIQLIIKEALMRKSRNIIVKPFHPLMCQNLIIGMKAAIS